MLDEWKKQIGIAFYIKEKFAVLDQGRLWGPLYYPELPASEEELRLVEASLGSPLPTQYRQFLMCANGWKRFYQDVDIFGTDELRRGDRMIAAIEALDWLDANDVITKAGYSRKELLPIGISQDKENNTLFCITTSNAPYAGVVLWFSEKFIQAFLDFRDFFLAMCEYNSMEVKEFLNSGDVHE
jgi:hypothetical protein